MRKGIITMATAAILAGCNTPRGITTDTRYQRDTTAYRTPQNIQGNELRQETEKDKPFCLEFIILQGEEYYPLKNEYPEKDEAPFYLIKRSEHTRIEDPTTQEIKLIADTIYMPTLVTMPSGECAHRIKLRTDGEDGITFTKYDTHKIKVGVGRETHEDAPYTIKTLTIGTQGDKKQEWYVPRVEEEKESDKGRLPFYIFPKEGVVEVKNFLEGSITLVSLPGIYRPVAMPRATYDMRPYRMSDEGAQRELIRRVEDKRAPGQTLTIE